MHNEATPVARSHRTARPLGVLMLDTRFPRLLGDAGNELTWPFPVVYRVVRGARPERVVQSAPDPDVLDPFLDAARGLEREGVEAMTTSCGFLAAYQPELAAAVHVPVFTSALLQVPFAAQMIKPGQVVAILTVREVLTERHFNGLGWSAAAIPVAHLALLRTAISSRLSSATRRRWTSSGSAGRLNNSLKAWLKNIRRRDRPRVREPVALRRRRPPNFGGGRLRSLQPRRDRISVDGCRGRVPAPLPPP